MCSDILVANRQNRIRTQIIDTRNFCENSAYQSLRFGERTPVQKYRESQAIDAKVRHNCDNGQRPDELVADITGIGSRNTYHKLSKVMEAADDDNTLAKELVVELETGETSIHGAYTDFREWEKEQEPDPEPEPTEPEEEDTPEIEVEEQEEPEPAKEEPEPTSETVEEEDIQVNIQSINRGMEGSDERSIVQCIECGTPMPVTTDSGGESYLMGMNECPDCGGEDFEKIEAEDIGDSSKTVSG